MRDKLWLPKHGIPVKHLGHNLNQKQPDSNNRAADILNARVEIGLDEMSDIQKKLKQDELNQLTRMLPQEVTKDQEQFSFEVPEVEILSRKRRSPANSD